MAIGIAVWIDVRSRHPVRDEMNTSSRPSSTDAGTSFGFKQPDAIDRAAELYKLPPELIRAVIWAESAGDASFVSPSGRIGLMGLTEDTAKRMFVGDAHDPSENIFGGARYLRYLANQLNGDILLTVAAYRSGLAAVQASRGVPQHESTREYVLRVMSYYYQLKKDTAAPAYKAAAEPSRRRSAKSEPAEYLGPDVQSRGGAALDSTRFARSSPSQNAGASKRPSRIADGTMILVVELSNRAAIDDDRAVDSKAFTNAIRVEFKKLLPQARVLTHENLVTLVEAQGRIWRTVKVNARLKQDASLGRTLWFLAS